MEYKYDGLTVYRTDTELHYVWDGTSWEIASNGIYGGSGSLVGDTFIEEGFIGSNPNDETYKLILSASSSTENFNYVSNFSRNGTGDVQFKNSLLFGTFSGPYINFSPDYDSILGFYRGGLSLGTGYIDTHERLKIESNGVIRFKPFAPITASINIYETDGHLTLGYNWYGFRDVDTIGSSFLKFEEQVLSINHTSTFSSTYTHSVIFYNSDNEYTIDVNGNMRASGILLGNTNAYHTLSNQGIGFGIQKDTEEFSIFNNNNTKSIILSNNQISLGFNNYTIQVTQSTTFSVHGSFETHFKTKLWDNSFNVDRAGATGVSDNYWSKLEDPENSFNDTSESTGVRVFLNSSFDTQDSEFMFITNGYTAKNTVSSWVSNKRPYDRIFYFYNNSYGYHITHELSWYLSNNGGDNWKKIGIVETGNQDSYNQEFGATVSYASRYYSNSVLVPSDMDLKIRFRFRNSFTPDVSFGTSSAPSVIFAVLRSGKWRTDISSDSISNI
jgi:hypothetical protein